MAFHIASAASMLAGGLLALGIPAQTPAVLANSDGSVRVEYQLSTGSADVFFQGTRRIAGAVAEVRLGSARVRSSDYSQRTLTVTDIQDAQGIGKRFEIALAGGGAAAMKQVYYLYDGREFLLTEVSLEGSALSSNWMSPLLVESPGGTDLGGGGDLRALAVPWDNDRFVRYNAGSLNRTGTSYEASAFYDNSSRRGLVVGSVTHDLWKTGIDFTGSGGKLSRLAAYGGAADANTRDVSPHGSVRGGVIRSPRIFVGFYADWRDGLEVFAGANAAAEPPLPWSGGPIFAWNSWGEMQGSLDEAKAAAVSDFFRSDLQPGGFHDGKGVVYVNLDAGGGGLGATGLKRFVDHCKANGQKAGTYSVPFFTRSVGPELLRDPAGNLILSPDQNAYARDPTHPNTRNGLKNFVTSSLSQGFEYIKVDFVTYGDKESGNGKWYDPNVMTGTQAYVQAMRFLDSLVAGRMHINLSISPLFPYAQAHSRRVSCDAFGDIGSVNYMMNSASYGWWLGGRLYAYNDPDHLVLGQWTEQEARSRFTSGVAGGGGFMMLGDDFSNPARHARARQFAGNPAVNAVARLGKPFRPVEGNTGDQPADVLELHHDGYVYLAVFNYSGSAATQIIPLARLGITAASVEFEELWTGTKVAANGTLSVSVPGRDARLYKSTQPVVAAARPKLAPVLRDMLVPIERSVNLLGAEIPARLRARGEGVPAASGWYAYPDGHGTRVK